MSLPADYHMHTPLCQHASGEPRDYAARAQEIGLREIGFSDHSPMRLHWDNWRMEFEQLAEYVEKVRKARRDFPLLTIRLALEVDYLPGCADWVRELASLYPWDYFIGSVHYISRSFVVDDPKELPQWKERDPFEIWEAYFGRLAEAAACGLFDIIGHADLPKKFGIYPARDCGLLFERFLDAAQESGVVLEINTAGLRKECAEIYPSPRLPVTFGSDAHAPGEVGQGFVQAVELARQCGYTHYCRFEARRRFPAAL